MKKTPVHHINEFHSGHDDPDFYVNTLERHIGRHAFIEKPHKHDFYLCVVFTAGTGTHFIDFKKYTVKPGAVFFLSPGQSHRWNLSTDTKGYIFFHSAAIFELNYRQLDVRQFPFYTSIYQKPLLNLNKAQLNTMVALLQALYTENIGEHFMQREKTAALISLVYIELSRIYQPDGLETSGKKNNLFRLRMLEDLIGKHFREEKSASFYAEKMDMSRKHLNRITQEGLAKSVSDMIADRVILEAKRLLVIGGKTVGQVADELGYFDHSYFNRFFKRHAGKTPMEFRDIKSPQ